MGKSAIKNSMIVSNVHGANLKMTIRRIQIIIAKFSIESIRTRTKSIINNPSSNLSRSSLSSSFSKSSHPSSDDNDDDVFLLSLTLLSLLITIYSIRFHIASVGMILQSD